MIRINNITRTYRTWDVTIGLQLANSNKSDDYYNDGVFYMSCGTISKPFDGNTGRNLLRKWINGDIVLIKRDKNNAVWFGLNEEETMEIAFENDKRLKMPMRI